MESLYYSLIKPSDNIHKLIFQREFLINITKIVKFKILRSQMYYRMENNYQNKFYGNHFFKCMTLDF